jgi:hypothetical protein
MTKFKIEYKRKEIIEENRLQEKITELNSVGVTRINITPIIEEEI